MGFVVLDYQLRATASLQSARVQVGQVRSALGQVDQEPPNFIMEDTREAEKDLPDAKNCVSGCGLNPGAPAFWIAQCYKAVPLTYTKLLRYLKYLLKKAHLDSVGAGMHCLRRAGAAYMYSLGPSVDDVRQAGNWKSLAALIYLTKPLSGRVESDRIVSYALRVIRET